MSKETRTFQSPVELREDGDKKKIVGYAAVFNEDTEIAGMFTERIAPGAFKESLNKDVRALFNHDQNQVLGRISNGTLRLEEDSHGLKYTITPPDTQAARDVMALLEDGYVSQSSFSFRPIRQEWDHTNNTRTVLEVELYDVGPVTMPAYDGTEAALRCKSNDEAVRKEKRIAIHQWRKRQIEIERKREKDGNETY